MVNTPTNFLNMKRRRIYQGERGGFFVKDSDGKMKRGIKASFRKVGSNGDESKLGPKNRDSVPVKLRRAVRKNAGVARKPAKNNNGNAINNMLNAIIANVAKPVKAKRRVVAALPSPARVVRHPMNRPKKAKAAAKRRVMTALPSPARVVRHPMNRPKKAKAAAKRRVMAALPSPARVVRHPMNRPVAANYMLLPSSPDRIPRLPAPPVVKRHPMNRPKAANNNFGPFQRANLL
jgi:hypothetical protein